MPADALDNHIALDAIHKDLVKRYSADRFSEVRMGGLALGAMHSLSRSRGRVYD